jgi:hypothetical protein
LCIVLCAHMLLASCKYIPPNRDSGTNKKSPKTPTPLPEKTTVSVGEKIQRVDAPCIGDSLETSKHWVFKKNRVSCKQSEGRNLCSYRWFRVTSVRCRKDEDDGDWDCNTNSAWSTEASMVCPPNHSPCHDSIDACHAEYDPVDVFIYVCISIFCAVVATTCLCSLAWIVYCTHCLFMVDSKTPSHIERGFKLPCGPLYQKKREEHSI